MAGDVVIRSLANLGAMMLTGLAMVGVWVLFTVADHDLDDAGLSVLDQDGPA